MLNSMHTTNPNSESTRMHASGALEKKMALADAISFDFFDTLFVRTLLDPEDAFDLLGKRFGIDDFRSRRRAAQAEAFRRIRKAGRREITLEDIYTCFDRLPVAPQDAMRAEYELELSLLHPNAEMLDIFNLALNTGKPVAITSDMYLPADFFREALRRHDLAEVPLFISSDRNATKRDRGELFDLLAAELRLAPERILHIGDNLQSDIRQAEARGLSVHFYSEQRKPQALRFCSPETSLARGLLRKHRSGILPDSCQELGFLYGGAAAVGFLDWIGEKSRCDRIDHVLFLARDGYILHHLADSGICGQLPPHHYFLGSRTAFTLSAMNDANFLEFIPFLLSGAEGLSPAELLERIDVSVPDKGIMEGFGLDEAAVVTHARLDQLAGFLYAYRWEILKICRRNRRALFSYLKALGIRAGSRVALVDIGWNGTTQDAFELAIRNLIDLEVFGYYFCLADTPGRWERQSHRRMTALFSPPSVSADLVARLYENRIAVELFFSAPHHSVVGLSCSSGGSIAAVEDRGQG